MFQTSLSGKAGSAVVRYLPEDGLFDAVIIKTNAEGKLEQKRVKDTDLYLLYKQIRHELGNEKMSALVMKKFVRTMGSELRVLSTQRRAFLGASKGDFAKVRALLAKAKAEKNKAAGKAGKVAKKGASKKGAVKKVGAKKAEAEAAEETE